jgi:hypothetical protein
MTLTWRKSSRSGGGSGNGNGGDCVEVAHDPNATLLRDSKTGDDGDVLRTSPAAFGALLHAVKRPIG